MVMEAKVNWTSEAAKQLENLGRLKRNWDSYDGLPLSLTAKRSALDALEWLKDLDLSVPAVVLDSAGNVHFEWRSKGGELEIGFGPTVEYVKVDSQGCIEGGGIVASIRRRLRQLILQFTEGL